MKTLSKARFARLLMLCGLLALGGPAVAQEDEAVPEEPVVDEAATEEPTVDEAVPEVDSGFYLEVSGGASRSLDQQAKFDVPFGGSSGDVDFKAGFLYGGAVGFRIERIRFELASQFRRQEVESVTLSSVKMLTRGDLDVTTGILDVIYDFDLGWPVSPYLGGGIGFARLDLEATQDESTTPFVVDDTVNEFAWNILAGVSIAIAPGTELFLGYRRLELFDEATFDAVMPGVGSGDFDMDFSANEFSGGIRYTF